jgi:hypothetical protein
MREARTASMPPPPAIEKESSSINLSRQMGVITALDEYAIILNAPA